MLGQPVTMLIPQVVGFELTGKLAEGATATDLVLTVTRDAAQEGRRRQVRRVLRRRPRPAAARRPRDDREHGARVRRDLRHLSDRRRDAALPRAHGPLEGARSRSSRRTRKRRASGAAPKRARYTDTLSLDLDVRRAEPRGPEAPAGSRSAESRAAATVGAALEDRRARASKAPRRIRQVAVRPRGRRGRDRRDHELHEHVEPVRADRRGPAREEGRGEGPHAQAVGEDEPRARLARSSPTISSTADLLGELEKLGFNLVGYGCTTCIGNSGPLPEEIAAALAEDRRRRVRRALGQSQLRRPHPSGGARELPRVAAARRRVRARGQHEHRPHEGAARHGQGRQARLPQGHLADVEGDPRSHRDARHLEDVQDELRAASSTATSNWKRSSPRPARPSPGSTTRRT